MPFNIPSEKRSSRTTGQALVEFAIMVPLLLFLLVGIIDLGRVFHAYIAITNASREGARYATRPGVILEDLYVYEGEDCFDQNKNQTLKSKVRAEAEEAGIVLDDSNICFNVNEGNPPIGIRGDPIRVTVRYELNLILGWFFSEPLQLSHYTEMLVP